MEIMNGSNVYDVDRMVAENKSYRLYLCQQKQIGRQCLLQIAAALEGEAENDHAAMFQNNSRLDRAAYILRELKQRAEETEAEYAKVVNDPKKVLNYNLSFPELVDSFISCEQGNRRVNILAFRSVDEITNLIPLVNITEKDRLRVDLRTCVWILGKALKLLVFTHTEGISIGDTSANNILIEPGRHYTIILDMSGANMFTGEVPAEIRRQEIVQLAQAAVTILGGDSKGVIPDDGHPAYSQLTGYILRLARGSESNALRAHRTFYEIADRYWERAYHPFTTLPL